MGVFLDFQSLKSHVRIEHVIPMLGLKMKDHQGQHRGACPVCKSGGDRALVITEVKASFYCFAAKKGGDVISLVSHIRGIGQREAAEEIARHFGLLDEPTAPTVPQEQQKREPTLSPLTYLEYEHPLLDALGIEPEDAERIGLGYAPKGTLSGHVAIPVRLPDGSLIGYVGVLEAKLPKAWRYPEQEQTPQNVVRLRPKSA